jgi:hypothetical protein
MTNRLRKNEGLDFFEIPEYFNSTTLVGIFRFDEPYILLAVLLGNSLTAAIPLPDLMKPVDE